MKYLISACLANQPVRYDGKAYHFEKIQYLIENNQVIIACPESLGGLPTPRAPAEIVDGTALDVINGKTKVITQQNEDVTSAFIQGALKTLELAQRHQVDIVVLKENSPSCGRNFIYDGTFTGEKILGRGVTTELLIQHGFQVFTEQEFLATLHDESSKN